MTINEWAEDFRSFVNELQMPRDDYKGIISYIDDAITLLKEQPEVVTCRDCKHWSAERINDFNKCRRWINVGVKNFATMGDWFCADGERRDDDG